MSEFVISWELGNVSNLTGTDCCSPIHYHMDIPWYLMTRKHSVNGVDHFSLFLTCNDDCIYDDWSCTHNSKVVIVNRNNADNSISYDITNKFNKQNDGWGKRELVLFNDVLDVQRGFIQDDKVLLEARITVKDLKGIKKNVIPFDFTHQESDSAAFTIEGQKIYTSRGFFAIESPFFADLFIKEDEMSPADFELNCVKVEQFTDLMHAVYPSYKQITADSYKHVLELAECFQLQRAIDRVEEYLIKTTKLKVSAKLALSEKHNLELLQLHCIHSLATPEAVKALEKTDEYKVFSDKLKLALLSRVFALIK